MPTRMREGNEVIGWRGSGSADLLADDVVRLLCYRSHIPRSLMVDYLKVLLAFHLGRCYLPLLKLLPELVRRRAADPICARSR